MKTRSVIVKFLAVAAAVIAAGFVPASAGAQDVTMGVPSAFESSADFDYASAVPMPLPQLDAMPDDAALAAMFEEVGEPGATRGARGSGQLAPVRLFDSKPLDSSLIFEPQEFGTSQHPFTTSRVDTPGWPVSKEYPFRAAGKLYFTDPAAGNFVCSASLIKRGVIVTAAHCVAKYGGKRFYTNFRFVPALNGATAPYGTYTGAAWWVMTSYFNGTDVCAPGAAGVVCRNDVAVIRLNPVSTVYPGTRVGWFGYGWNNWGFNAASDSRRTMYSAYAPSRERSGRL